MEYLDFDRLFDFIPQCAKLQRFLDLEFFKTAAGSSHNHQAWPGGYLDHVRETMNIAIRLHEAFHDRGFDFFLGDALLVLFLHDLEKPYNTPWPSKEYRREFRSHLIREAGITLSPEQENALEYVEGEHDYSNKERKMGPMAAFCHMCDIASARIWYNKGMNRSW